MKKMIKKYNSSFEFKGLVDGILFTTILYIAYLGVKFILLNIS